LGLELLEPPVEEANEEEFAAVVKVCLEELVSNLGT
jgi:hypothetical protein